jgi:CDP-paratose 2-epimerase
LSRRYALITGGAGFVGSNLADRLASDGMDVVLLDALARPGVERNVDWLRSRHGERVRLIVGDVRHAHVVDEAVSGADQVFHLAAQVAVTTSLDDPRADFEVNALGTLNVLEAVRARRDRPPVVFTSTNKVYGGLPDVPLTIRRERWEPEDAELGATGLSERRPLDFHSPYGCSKGAADQYVVDYARTFGLQACVLRMSCIYGPRQFGNEDQGWVAHFLIRARRSEPIALYGDGRQVRDVLFVSDLVDAFVLARDGIARLSGRAFNIGGGPAAAVSLRELLARIEALGATVDLERGPWRVGDQRWYVSNIRAFRDATGWSPQVGVAEGLERLDAWITSGQGPAVRPERAVVAAR